MGRSRPEGTTRRVTGTAQSCELFPRVTISLDEDIVAIFRAEAFRGGPRYQVAINQALRSHLRERERSEARHAAETVLKGLAELAVRAR